MTLPPHTQELPLLLVDDNPQNLRLVNYLLRSDGFSVWNADSAEQAIALLKGQRFSLVLMDIQLPGMDGLELTRQIRNTPDWKDLIVVAFTAYAMSSDEVRMKEAGCDGYISKPIDTRAFPNRVRSYLGLRSSDSPEIDNAEIALLKAKLLAQVREEVARLLSLSNVDLAAPPTFSALHRWVGLGGSVGLGTLTDLARDAEQYKSQPGAAPYLRPALAAILAFVDSSISTVN